MKNYQRILFCVLALLLSAPTFLLAGSYEISPGVAMEFTEPPSTWVVSREPATFLIAERAASLNPQQLEAAQKAGFKTADAAARKILLDNELFLFNPQSESHLEVDFSPLKQGEKPASDRSLKASAKYAAEELSEEEGLTEVKTEVTQTVIDGTTAAYRVDATYLKQGQPSRFIGVIAFARNNWIYLYYTGPQAATEDHANVDLWLKSVKVTGSKQ